MKGTTGTSSPAPSSPQPRKNGGRAETDKLKKNTKSKGGRNYVPKGVGNGGKREGSGRKTKEETIIARGRKELIEGHYEEEVEVTYTDRGSGQTVKVKKPRTLIALEKLFKIGTEGEGNWNALEKWLDRSLGKAKQDVEHSGAIKVDEQRTPSKAELAAGMAYETALEDEDDSEEE